MKNVSSAPLFSEALRTMPPAVCLLMAMLAPIGAFGQDNAVTKDLGRLFFSPQQRQELDRRRELNIQEATVEVESLYTVNGQVSRSSGKTTTWINGASQNDAYKPRNPALVPLKPVEEEPATDVRVGQTLDRNSGSINNGLGGGEIKIKSANPPAKPAAKR